MTQPGMPAQTGPAPHKFYFNVGSVDSFERKMEDAQEDLGWTSDSFVPIVYTNELSWSQVRACTLPALGQHRDSSCCKCELVRQIGCPMSQRRVCKAVWPCPGLLLCADMLHQQ